MLAGNAYAKFENNELILRDYLAVARSILANERTLLAYIRTSLTSIVVGVSFIKFFNGTLLNHLVGWGFIALGVVSAIYGVIRFYKMRSLIFTEEKTRSYTPAPSAEDRPISPPVYD